jgi:hypothetical protein
MSLVGDVTAIDRIAALPCRARVHTRKRWYSKRGDKAARPIYRRTSSRYGGFPGAVRASAAIRGGISVVQCQRLDLVSSMLLAQVRMLSLWASMDHPGIRQFPGEALVRGIGNDRIHQRNYFHAPDQLIQTCTAIHVNVSRLIWY